MSPGVELHEIPSSGSNRHKEIPALAGKMDVFFLKQKSPPDGGIFLAVLLQIAGNVMVEPTRKRVVGLVLNCLPPYYRRLAYYSDDRRGGVPVSREKI